MDGLAGFEWIGGRMNGWINGGEDDGWKQAVTDGWIGG